MSERRIVEETPCEHDQVFPHSYMAPHGCHKEGCMEPSHCRGGSRRVLTEGQYVLIEKVDGEWPAWVFVGLGWELDESHDLNTVMDGLWRERPR